jgi:hypothetical protein
MTSIGVAETTPKPLGVVQPPSKAQSPFPFFLPYGGGWTTPRPAVGVNIFPFIYIYIKKKIDAQNGVVLG